ncbi:MAG: 4Fe-4S dicluster domain-containing protein, partial [Desulforhabdus sp.]|nr:4Fe-4S dicluster domain-containing protein [Desulforhabdus sp.]
GCCMDETTALAHLILPTHTPLECWDDYSPVRGIVGLLQPVMGNVFDTRHLGDVLISSGKKVKGSGNFPWADFYQLLRESWAQTWQDSGSDKSFDDFWLKAVQAGGIWQEQESGSTEVKLRLPSAFPFPDPKLQQRDEGSFHFTAYPSIQFFDGRAANRLWIQELPDPMTQITWGGWLEIHPETAARLKIQKGDLLEVRSSHGVLQAPAIPIQTVPRDSLAMPLGQGHTDYGRFATGLPANPMELFPPDIDPLSAGLVGPSFSVSIKKSDERFDVANTDGSLFQHHRDIVQTVSYEEYSQAAASGYKPVIDYPMPTGFDPGKDFYPPHPHKDYRWAMVVDLDRCIGCGACVMACYAENNVAVVGRQQVLKGREMSWIRVQRYFEEYKTAAKWLVMLCQHCDEAPCESVCPIFAPHHSVEGLNNQVYNRCFGTRFCSQNDPYKVRRFNWFMFTRPTPLDWQLNPDVTVRQKGIMEKCSFCVQRIIEAKIKARKKDRKVRDGDFTTACAQTCPTNALIFGSLMDPDSRVSQLINDPRAYQVFRHLNTKPAVIYLKRLTREV